MQESSLSDKEWRQMRRKLSKLDFEPIPDTSSHHEDSNKSSSEGLQKSERVSSSACIASNSAKCSPTVTRECCPYTDTIHSEKDNSKLPSTYKALSPSRASSYQRPEQNRRSESASNYGGAEYAALDAQMAIAHHFTRRSVMRAIVDINASKAKKEVFERMKLSASHIKDVRTFQDEVAELKQRLAHTEARQERIILQLDRFSAFTVKRARRNLMCWNGQRLLATCVAAWSRIAREAKSKRSAFRHAFNQYRKRLLLAVVFHWKERVRQERNQNQLQEQQDRYEQYIAAMANEYQLTFRQLNLDIDNAKARVEKSQETRQKLDDMHLVFLRGMSAMNIEALTVLNSKQRYNDNITEQDRSVPLQEFTAEVDDKTHPTSFGGPIAQAYAPIPDRLTLQEPANRTPLALVSVSDSVDLASVPSPVAVDRRPGRTQIVPTSKCGWSGLNTMGLRSAEIIQQLELNLPNCHPDARVGKPPLITDYPPLVELRSTPAPSSPRKARSSLNINSRDRAAVARRRSQRRD